MSLFTGKGDDGTTSTFGCDQRLSKSSAIAEALGQVDTINSYLGLVKVKTRESGFEIEVVDGQEGAEAGFGAGKFYEIIDSVQQNLFIVQAELAGADKSISKEKVDKMSALINYIEKELPPIKSFFVSGGCELSSMFDFARTLVRTAERRVVAVHDEGVKKINSDTLAYMNRLSSLMYAMARLSNHLSGVTETAPDYQ
jgi:cob(I)alamin adenosyltransferase